MARFGHAVFALTRQRPRFCSGRKTPSSQSEPVLGCELSQNLSTNKRPAAPPPFFQSLVATDPVAGVGYSFEYGPQNCFRPFVWNLLFL